MTDLKDFKFDTSEYILVNTGCHLVRTVEYANMTIAFKKATDLLIAISTGKTNLRGADYTVIKQTLAEIEVILNNSESS